MDEEKNDPPAWEIKGPENAKPICFVDWGRERKVSFTWDELEALQRVARAQLEIEAKRRQG